MPVVLVVDDDPQVLAFVRHVLNQAGHETTCCESLVEVRARDLQRTADVAVVDWKLPGGDGILAFQQMRGDRPDLPGVLTSGFTLSSVEFDRALDAGFSGFLQKPLRAASLASRED